MFRINFESIKRIINMWKDVCMWMLGILANGSCLMAKLADRWSQRRRARCIEPFNWPSVSIMDVWLCEHSWFHLVLPVPTGNSKIPVPNYTHHAHTHTYTRINKQQNNFSGYWQVQALTHFRMNFNGDYFWILSRQSSGLLVLYVYHRQTSPGSGRRKTSVRHSLSMQLNISNGLSSVYANGIVRGGRVGGYTYIRTRRLQMTWQR